MDFALKVIKYSDDTTVRLQVGSPPPPPDRAFFQARSPSIFERTCLQMPPTSETLGQTTTPGTLCPTLCEKCMGSLTSPGNQCREDAGDGTYALSSLSEETRMSNRAICRCHCKGSTFSSVILRPRVLVWSGARTLDPPPPCTTVRHSANQR